MGPQSEPERPNRVEAKRLQLGYQVTLQNLAAFQPTPNLLDDEEAAYFWAIDREYMRIPPEFAYEQLEQDIPTHQRVHIQTIWRKVLAQRAIYEVHRKTLEKHWENAPEVTDPEVKAITEPCREKIQNRFFDATKAMIAESQMDELSTHPALIAFDQTGTVNELTEWQTKEKALRRLFYEEQKNYITALRCYYEMLLETSSDGKNGVLTPDHPLRMRLVIRNRYTRVLDAAHQAVTIAKAAHHEQGKNRLRKVGNIPYVNHVIDVVRAYIYDVVGAEIGETKMDQSLHLIAGIMAGGLHDVLEDTDLEESDLMIAVKRLADRYDTRIDQSISSGFGRKRKEIKERSINLLNPQLLDEIFTILKILNKKRKDLSPEELEMAANRSITSTDRIQTLMTREDDEITQIPTKGAQSKTFQTFPISYDDSMDRFLIKLSAQKNPMIAHIALLLKMEDRADNLKTIDALKPEKQLAMVRATVTRLLSYIMLDKERFLRRRAYHRVSLRLAKAVLHAYRLIMEKNPFLIEPIDTGYEAQTQTWLQELEKNTAMREEPERMTQLLKPYRDIKAQAA